MKQSDFIQGLHALKNVDEVWAFGLVGLSGMGLNSVCHGYADPRDTSGKLVLRNNYPDVWRSLYYDRGIYKYDLYSKHVAESTIIVEVNGLSFSSSLKKDARLYDEVWSLANFGVTNGFIVPLRLARNKGFGGMFLGNVDAEIRDPGRYLVENRETLLLMGLHLDARLVQLATQTDVVESNLTARERECLKWLASGLMNQRIAERLGIASSTVEFHLRNAKSKLNAATREQALAIAIGRGIVHI